MESSHNPSKLLIITQKIEEEKELLQEKQKQVKDIKNYLTNLEYRKTQELKELETYIKNSSVYIWEHLKLISSVLGEGDTEKWYFGIFKKNNKWNIIFLKIPKYHFSVSPSPKTLDINFK
ncbi:hypothetical protein [Spiroplasma endosymbiont of Polydrusus pterygomalis]|uniref:hypothetical protein n=1 Tax=Spiroplasma endosymbiont of Polydrusus pterygomalis TaxID=3139327 RepID=UPI003CCB2575